VVDRLRGRFAIGRVCVVADRGMISEATIAGLEQRGLEYILGVRERSDRLVREVVLADERPFTPLVVERADGGETQLFAKEVLCEGRRYILCRNEAEAAKDRADRQAILDGLARQLARGDKALIGNSAYRRYLRRTRKGEPAFEIDPASLAEEAKFDGVFVLRTNTRLHPLQAMLRYRDLLQVEELFRRTKSVLRTRPIYHSSDAAIRGHVFCSFLALMLQKELAMLCAAKGFRPEWQDLLRDLDRLQQGEIEQDGKTWRLRTEVGAVASAAMLACGIAIPPRLQGIPPPDTPAPAAPSPSHASRRRGRPRRGARLPNFAEFAHENRHFTFFTVQVGSCCRRSSPCSAPPRASGPNGRTCCETLIGCSRLDWPPIRPDTRRSPEGLGASLGVRLCRSPSNASKSSAAASAGDATLPRKRSGWSSRPCSPA
jgi:hypothetical protein